VHAQDPASHPEIAIVAYTGHDDAETIIRMIVAGAIGYAVKGHGPDELVHAVRGAAAHIVHVDAEALPGLFTGVVRLARAEHARLLEIERLHAQLESSYEQTAMALARALRARDNDTQDHVARVTRLARLIGARLGLGDTRLSDLEYGAIFHDIGKIGMPDEILHNTDELSDQEWEVVRSHTILGEEIIRPIGFLKNVATIVRHSHERWDGRGYPDGLAGEDIPIESRIIFACDAWDAMNSNRSYQEALEPDAAVARMRELSGAHFDPRIVDALLSFVAEEATA
jgi:putative nucleotidyltransferase with HDIG domain